MYIFQPDRYLLRNQIKKYGRYIKGKTLDIGAGQHSRYQHCFESSDYIKMDIHPNENLDMVGSADNIPVADESFDSVVSTQVFEHLKDPKKAAHEIWRVIKPGGYVLITVPQWNEMHEEPNDYYRYTKFGIKEIFEICGFETVASDQRGGFFIQLTQMIIRYLLDRFSLHHKRIVGRLFSWIFKLLSFIAIRFDNWDDNGSNRKHAIGWLFIFKKPGI